MNKVLITIATVCCCFISQAADKIYDIILSPCQATKSWQFHNGGEFPGAKGRLTMDKEVNKIKLNFDFSKGGAYVSAHLKRELPENIKSISMTLTPQQTTNINYRITDANGRTFQGRPKTLQANKTTKELFSLTGPWSSAWGGKTQTKQPKQPFKKVFLTVNKKAAKQGTIILNSLSAKSAKPLSKKFDGENFSVNSLGWKLTGKWAPSLEGMSLNIEAVNVSASKTNLSVTMPTMSRDAVQRFKLDTNKKKITLTYLPPLKKGGNTYNKYNFTIALSNGKGQKMEFPVILKGINSDSINFGKPTNSIDIKSSAVGTAVHFSYGKSGPFKGWRPYKKLIDSIAACGFKWIRDGARLKKDKQGNYSVRKYDLEWMAYAKSKGIETIYVIDVTPRNTIEEYKKIVNAIVRDTKPYITVYELGNEPHNFGDWKKFGGPWNGKEPNNDASPWVLEHRKYTNALADFVKAAAPKATVIGIGACTCTNFRYLDLGITKNLDGVVDHPYTYSMPPEVVPFGWAFQERDGVKTGDANNSFKGMMESYVEQFKKTGQMRSIWVTEFGYTTFWYGNNKSNGKFGLYAGVTEQAQAVYLVRRFIESFTLPIAATCQYDFIDDYGSSMTHDESNFGIIRADHSKKPAYHAIQRMTSLFNGYSFDKNADVVIEMQKLHRSAKRRILVENWDKVDVKADNSVKTYTFTNPNIPNQRMLAVWSALPYTREFNNRVTNIRLKGWSEFAEKPVAIDIITGKSYSVPMSVDGDDLVLKALSLKGHPIVIKFIKK